MEWRGRGDGKNGRNTNGKAQNHFIVVSSCNVMIIAKYIIGIITILKVILIINTLIIPIPVGEGKYALYYSR